MQRALEIGIAANDRMLPLLTGDVCVPGYELEFDRAEPNQIFWKALHEQRYDVTEMSLAAHAILTARGENPFVGLPVYTSRMFRHGSIFVSAASGITSPRDLAGRRIGVPEYQMTAAVWVRGFLHDDFGVDAKTIEWFTGGVNKPGRAERIALRVTEDYKVTSIGPQQTLDKMLRAGEIDAIIAPQIPASFQAGDAGVRRLFSDPRAAETAYFEANAIFPIMHLLVIRRERMQREPSLAALLHKAFSDAKDYTFARLYDADALHAMLPWLISEIEATMAVMGRDYWPYGIARNRNALATFIRHLQDQGLIDRPLEVDEMFAPALLAT